MQEQMQQVLQIIKNHFGTSIFTNPNQFKAALADTPIKTDADTIRNLLRIAICEIQAYSRMEAVLGSNPFIIDNLASEMSTKYMIDKVASKTVIACIAELHESGVQSIRPPTEQPSQFKSGESISTMLKNGEHENDTSNISNDEFSDAQLPISNNDTAIKNIIPLTAVEELSHYIITNSRAMFPSDSDSELWTSCIKSIYDFLNDCMVKKSAKLELRADYEKIISRLVKKSSDREIMLDAIDRATDIHSVVVKENNRNETYIDVVEGFQFERGWISPRFASETETMEAILCYPYILVTDKKIIDVHDILPILEQIVKTGGEMVVVADDVEGDALDTLIVNKSRLVINNVAIKAPGYGDRRKAMLEDIAIITGGHVVSSSQGIEFHDIKLSHLGRAESIICTEENTVIFNGSGSTDSIKTRIANIKNQIEMTTSEFDKEMLQMRLAKISGGIICIAIGAATEKETSERIMRINESLFEIKCALSEGVFFKDNEISEIIGDISFENMKTENDHYATNIFNILKNGIKHITGEQVSIAYNKCILDEIKTVKTAMGYDRLRECSYDQMLKRKIIPIKVLRETIQYAVDIAVEILLTT